MSILRTLAAFALLSALLGTVPGFAQCGAEDLGSLGGPDAEADGVSGDGAVIVGRSNLVPGPLDRVFLWTVAGGMVGITPPLVTAPRAVAVSADGGTVLINGFTANGQRIYLWTAAGGAVDIGDLGGGNSSLGTHITEASRYISEDGSVVVGTSALSSGVTRAFRWTAATGMVDLGTLTGSHSSAFVVSGDGSTVIGQSGSVVGVSRAFRWRVGSGMQDLGTAKTVTHLS